MASCSMVSSRWTRCSCSYCRARCHFRLCVSASSRKSLQACEGAWPVSQAGQRGMPGGAVAPPPPFAGGSETPLLPPVASVGSWGPWLSQNQPGICPGRCPTVKMPFESTKPGVAGHAASPVISWGAACSWWQGSQLSAAASSLWSGPRFVTTPVPTGTNTAAQARPWLWHRRKESHLSATPPGSELKGLIELSTKLPQSLYHINSAFKVPPSNWWPTMTSRFFSASQVHKWF